MVNTVSDIMTTDVILAKASDSIADVARKMKDHVVGFIPIIEGDNYELKGVVTDRDLVIRGYAENKSFDRPISDVMTSHSVVVDCNCSIDEVAQSMSDNKIRRVCVVDNNNLVGICALGDLAARSKYENDASEALSDISNPANINTIRQ